MLWQLGSMSAGRSHVHDFHHSELYLLRTLRRWEDHFGTNLKGTLTTIAFIIGPSSLTTMVVSNTVALCNRSLAPTLEERDALGTLMNYRLFPSETIFDPPATTADDHLVIQGKSLLRLPLVPARLGKKPRPPPQSFTGPSWEALICLGITSGRPPH